MKNLEVFRPFMTAQAIEKVTKAVRDAPKYTGLVALPDLDTQPPYIQGGTVKSYQLEGIRFLVQLHDSGMLGGILGDEMGLGKTMQTISFLGFLKHERPDVVGTHLIVSPLSVLQSWINELARWCPSLKVAVYHGGDEERKQVRDAMLRNPADVLVTTYEMLTADGCEHFFKVQMTWEWVVLDEGHRIKSDQTQLSALLRRVESRGRLVLSGTPLQNDMGELFNLLSYLFDEHKILTDKSLFEDAYDRQQSHVDKERLHLAHKLLSVVMLRRTKDVVMKQLPPKKELKLLCPLSPEQIDFYQSILRNDISALTGGEAAAKWQKLNSLVMLLRQCCNHPLLVSDVAYPSLDNTAEAHQQLVAQAGKMQILNKLLLKLQQEGHHVLLFSQFSSMLDILEQFCELKDYPFVRLNGSVSHVQWNMDVTEYNKPGSHLFVFLMST